MTRELSFADILHRRKISEICAEFELESDEFYTAEQKAERILPNLETVRRELREFRAMWKRQQTKVTT